MNNLSNWYYVLVALYPKMNCITHCHSALPENQRLALRLRYCINKIE